MELKVGRSKKEILKDFLSEREDAGGVIAILPESFTSIPCECKRRKNDQRFIAELGEEGWEHHIPGKGNHSLGI